MAFMFRYLQPRFFSTLKVPIEAIKKLRDETSAPISQCKSALEETNLSHEEALIWLKQKGLLQAEKRLNKETREGVIGAMVTTCRSKVALVEVNCETDFVAKNDLFVSFVNNLMSRAIEAEYLMSYEKGEDLNKDEIEAFLHNSRNTGLFSEDSAIETLYEEYKLMISKLQENIRIRRIITLHSDKKKYGIYVHQGYDQYVGQQASIAEFEVEPELDEENEEELETFGEFADNIATQVLGAPPKYLRADQIPEKEINDAKLKVKEEMADRLSKAPAHTHEKIVEGKLNSSFYENILLPKMPYALSNDGIPVEDYWKSLEEELNKKINITNAFAWECK